MIAFDRFPLSLLARMFQARFLVILPYGRNFFFWRVWLIPDALGNLLRVVWNKIMNSFWIQ